MKKNFIVEKLTNKRIDNCVCCGKPVFETNPIGWGERLKDKYIFLDGDIIYGVGRQLTEKQRTPNAFSYFYNKGICTTCGTINFAIEFNFINYHDNSVENEDIFKTDVGWYLLGNKDVSEPINYIVSQSAFDDIPYDWVMRVVKTPYGNMHTHSIGLMSISRFDEDADIFLKLLDDLKKIIISD
ncbi:TPA: hypothetical protein U2I61_004264 [Providencia rettgeri]|nr:hypothetical protein [Providencia rettgeri]HEM7189726.1 hypothetical protein [Providencia rettgeri]